MNDYESFFREAAALLLVVALVAVIGYGFYQAYLDSQEE